MKVFKVLVFIILMPVIIVARLVQWMIRFVQNQWYHYLMFKG